MVHVMVFSTYKVELNIGKTRFKNQKNHEAVNMAITDAGSRPCWRGAHTQIVHVGISVKGPTQNTQKAGSEQGDGRMDDESQS